MEGIMFSPDMHLAIKEGRKSQTRRLSGLKEFNEHPDEWMIAGTDGKVIIAGK